VEVTVPPDSSLCRSFGSGFYFAFSSIQKVNGGIVEFKFKF